MPYAWRGGLGDVVGVQSLIESAAARYGVPPSIAVAVAQKESQFNQGARGAAGEIGVFQLMPGTAAGLGVNPYDLNQNIDGGVKFLSQLYHRFGDWTRALQGYNGGPGHVDDGTVSNAAQAYAVSVLNSADGSLTVGGGDGGAVVLEPGAGNWYDGISWEPLSSDGSSGDSAALSTTAKVSLGLAGLAVLLVAVAD